jgi:hypothetical protein
VTLDAQMLALIDDRIRRTITRTLRPGTFADRTADAAGMAVMDQDTTAVPVLIGGDVLVSPGDRVVLAQVGSAWVVLVSLGAQWPAERQYEYTAAGETTVTSVYADAPGIPVVANRTIVKARTASSLIARVDATAFYTVASTDLQWAVLLTDLDVGTTYGPTLIASWFSGDLNRTPHGRQVKLLNIPAGRYDAKLQWRRAVGTGTVTMNADDRYTFNIREAAPQV